MNIKKLPHLIIITALASLLSTALLTTSKAQTKPTGTELIQSKFSLIDHTGQAVTEKSYFGKYTLIFIGFSHCPNVCPVGLHTMLSAINKLGKEAQEIVPIFITIDPERDDVKRMAEYVGFFDKKLVGLTGSKAATSQATASLRAYFEKIEGTDSDKYLFDHSSVIYLMSKQGKYLAHFTSELGDQEIANRIKKIFKEETGNTGN